MRRRIGVLGSLCNPPHIGHAALARHATEQLGLERVLLIPTGQPAHRDPPAVSAALRLRMAEAAAADERVLECSSIEVDRPGPSYMADTLELLGLATGGAELVLLLGADQYETLDTWHEPARVRRLATIAVAPRNGNGIDLDADEEVVAMPEVDVSSSDIRAKVAAGQSIDGLVAAGVARLIAEEGLYRNP